MLQLQTLLTDAGALFINLFTQPDWRNIVDIVILTVLFYQVIKLVVNTRASSLFKGIVFVFALWWVASLLEITALQWLLQQVVGMGVIVLVVVFQPELRRALDQIGRNKWMRRFFGVHRHEVNPLMEKHVEEIVKALMNMSRKRIGALIVFERNTGLSDVTESGTIVDAEISQPLIENIFEPNTPLHDGAMIVRDERIDAAACILQLSENYSISRELGTRHRAAIGITEATDAISIIVSEETGIISMAQNGKLTRYMDAANLKKVLTGIFDPDFAQRSAAQEKKKKPTVKDKGAQSNEG